MNGLAPSRSALRALSRLCQTLESSAAPTTTTTHAAVCTKSTSRSHHQLSKPQEYRKVIQSSYNRSPKPTRQFTSSTQLRVQPQPSEETDPQNAATPTLPDITNYYTLFPSTIPNGPPGPGAPTQSPTQNADEASTSEFRIHNPTLRKEFLRLQSQHHPDKYTNNATAHQKALALSALINNAYKTLSDPLLRAQYLLQLQYDIDVTSEDNAAHPTDQETLMEVMEAQERVESATKQEEVDEIKEENERRLVETERKMGKAFEQGDVELAKEECVRLKYWRSLQGALNDWEPGKEIKLIH